MKRRIPVTVVGALLAVGLTATAVFAANGPGFDPRLPGANVEATHAEASADPTDEVETQEPEESEAPEASEAPEGTEAPEGSEAPGAHPSNHGGIVSQAAQGDVPEGCKNRGQYVSLVARGLVVPGAEVAAGTSVCDVPAADGKPEKTHGNGHGNGHGKPTGSAVPE